MSATVTRGAAGAGWTSAERSASVVIDRGAEAAAIAEFILESPTRVAVLYGKPRSGKSQLITQEVIPRLRALVGGRYAIGYGDCCEAGLPTMLAAGGRREPLEAMIRSNSIVVLDSFDRFLDQPRDAQRRVLEPLFTLLAAPGCVSILVLVTDVRQLTNVHALSEFVPRIGEAVRELGSITVADGLQRFSRSEPASAVEYSAGALELLTRQCQDLERAGYEVSFELLQLVDRWFRGQEHAPAGNRVVGESHVLAVNGVPGILAAYLDAETARLGIASLDEREVAETILEDVQTQRTPRLDQVDVDDIGRRVGVDSTVVSKVLGVLTGHRGLLHDVPGCGLRFVPPQVASVVHERLGEQRGALDRAHRVVEEGLRSWMELGTLLPSQRFAEVHRERRRLRLNAEQSRFLFLCALRREDNDVAGASTYWLHRLPDRDDAADILLASVLDDDPAVAGRSANLLREFPSADVRERLTFLALVHEEQAVRAAALGSLGEIRDHSVKRRLREEAADAKRPHRLRAIEALGIFHDDETTDLLKELVHDPKTPLPVRDAAITALSSIGTPQSVDALVDISLLDQDVMDRNAAAHALAATTSPKLNHRILARLGPPESIPWVRLSLFSVALAAGVVTFWIASVLSLGIGVVSGAFLLALLLAWPTSRLLVRLRKRQARRRSVRGVIAWVLLGFWAATVGLVLHGSTHLLIRRWKRAVTLLALQAVGLVLMWVAPLFADVLNGAIQWFYFGAGLLLFGGTYFVDVVAVFCETLLFADATTRRRRKAATYSAVLGNEAVTALVLDTLESDGPEEPQWARRLWKRFAGSANPRLLVARLGAGDPGQNRFVVQALKEAKTEQTVQELEQLWTRGDARLRSTIEAVLYRSPSQTSLETLDRLSSRPTLRKRLRYAIAKFHFGFRVWPIYLRVIGLVALPAVAVFMIHGAFALENPAWSSLVALRRALHSPLSSRWWFSSAREGTTVALTADFLARSYPTRSAGEFLEHLHDRSVASQPHLRGAIASALVVVLSEMPDEEIRGRILAASDAIVEALQQSDSVTVNRAVGTLIAGANADDPLRSAASLSVLKSLIIADSSDWAGAIAALTQVRYERALPLLDTLLQERSVAPIAPRLRHQIENISAIAVSVATNGENPSYDVGRLRGLLDSLDNQPVNLAAVRLLADSLRNDSTSTRIGNALKRIAAAPDAEAGYQSLLEQLTSEGAYGEAVTAFTDLKEAHPGSLWPGKILASIYHENIPGDAGSFEKSYEAMKWVTELPAYAELRRTNVSMYRSFRADFAEIALSAGRYEEVEALGAAILRERDTPTNRLNAALFMLIGRVMQRDSVRADSAIGALEQIVHGLPANFYNNWVYPGTRVFIVSSGLPQAAKDALLELCQAGAWHSPQRAGEIFARNRAALASLRGGSRGA